MIKKPWFGILIFIEISKQFMPETHQHDIFENRRQFQLERMILFSDAVFAIAITLLVIEIRIPQITEAGELNAQQLGEHLSKLRWQILGFVLSFVLIGNFWQIHHRVFGYVINFDGGLIWLNLFMLMMIAFLPFSTNLVSEYGYLNLAFFVYSLNLFLVSLMSFFIWLRISNLRRKLSIGLEEKKIRDHGTMRNLVIMMIFLLSALCMIPVSPFFYMLGRNIFFLIFPAMIILRRIYKVKG